LYREDFAVDRPGTRNIGIGLLILIFGLLITVGSHTSAESGVIYILAWGAVVVGTIQFFIGLYQYGVFSMRSEDGMEFQYTKIDDRAIIRSMIHQALSDDSLDQEEITLIQALFNNYSNEEVEFETIREMSKQVTSGDYNYFEDMKLVKDRLSNYTKLSIIRMVYLVSLADGVILDKEIKGIIEIAKTLNVHSDNFLPLINETKKLFKEADPEIKIKMQKN
jgi:uncharacterized tellurite resistance protein B-like protein